MTPGSQFMENSKPVSSWIERRETHCGGIGGEGTIRGRTLALYGDSMGKGQETVCVDSLELK